MVKTFNTDLTHKFLIALPKMSDPRFERSVIFICHHDKNGAMGVVINKAKTQLTLSELLPQIGIDGDIKIADSIVLDGGPIDIDRGFLIHSDDGKLSNERSLPLPHGLYLSSTKDILESLVTDKAPSRALMAIGYSGWGTGQLEREIQDNVWLIADSDPELIFADDLSRVWNAALKSIGVSPSVLSHQGGRA